MELIAHLLLAGVAFGFSIPLIIGSTLPDILFIIAYLAKNKKLHTAGECLHSVLIPPAIAAIGLIFDNVYLLMLSLGYGLHIVVDLFVHKEDGARYLYPFIKRKIRSGMFYWKSKRVILTTYIALSILLWIRYKK